jgi:hypothetical protein
MKIIVAALALALHGGATAFSLSQSSYRHAGSTALCAEPAARRAFLTAAVTAAVGVAAVSPAFAAESADDLAMPAATDWQNPELNQVGAACCFLLVSFECMIELLMDHSKLDKESPYSTLSRSLVEAIRLR